MTMGKMAAKGYSPDGQWRESARGVEGVGAEDRDAKHGHADRGRDCTQGQQGVVAVSRDRGDDLGHNKDGAVDGSHGESDDSKATAPECRLARQSPAMPMATRVSDASQIAS
jgi:hypothetical protein